MNIALIFAGGTGSRMHSGNLPKQFLRVFGKPIIIYTIEHFENNPNIDAIVVVCIKGWIDYLEEQFRLYKITKVKAIVTGGDSGQESIRNGLFKIRDMVTIPYEEVIVLIHDGVRPLINSQVIDDNITTVKMLGNAITVVPSIETIIEIDGDNHISRVADRKNCRLARAPQSFFLKDILEAHKRSIAEGWEEMIDSAMLMQRCGAVLHTVEGPVENIKITTPMDYYVFRAMVEAMENEQFSE